MRPVLFSRLVLVVLVVLLSSTAAWAQLGRVSGVVKDETGQTIKGATVTAENPSSSPSTLTATTDEKGRFTVIGLRTGQWRFTAEAPGFAPDSTTMGVKTLGAPNPAANFTLKRGAGVGVLGAAAKDLQAELVKADQLYNARQYDEAIGAYRAILAKAPALSVINLQIAGAYRNKKEYDNAIAAYNDLLKVDPANEKAKIGIAMTNLEKGDIATAEGALTAVANSPNPSREVFYNLGEVKFAKGEADQAATWYQKAVDADPNWGKPLFKLGLVALNKGDKDGAIKLLQKVVDSDPLSGEALQAKGMLEQLKQ